MGIFSLPALRNRKILDLESSREPLNMISYTRRCQCTHSAIEHTVASYGGQYGVSRALITGTPRNGERSPILLMKK